MEHSMEESFDSRYEDTFHWIKTKILAGSSKGILNLIFWRLPLIFIEGKVVAAFFYPDDKRQDKEPLMDTIRIPESKKIFKYESFIKSFRKAVDDETYGLWEKERNQKNDESTIYTIAREPADPKASFDFLDYFGIPCKVDQNTAKTQYSCLFFSFKCFDGCMEVWIASSKENEELLSNSYHVKKLKVLIESVQKAMDEEGLKTSKDALAGHVLKHDIMPSVFKSKENKSGPNDYKIELSEYLRSAFSVLHESLLDSLKWKENPCRLFILVNSRLFSPKLCFFLTEAQKEDYRKKYNDAGGVSYEEQTERKKAEEAIEYERTLRKKEAKSPFEFEHDTDIACEIMKDTEQAGTVSSLFKQRGFYELFLEETTFNAHPVLFKKMLIQRDWPEDQYSYPEKLEKIEQYFLLTLPNVKENNLQKNGHAGNTKYQFAMIPYFFRGHPFGCIAFFNPELRDKKRWYGYLNKVLNILDEKEGTIYQAAIKDLCQNIFEVVEEFNNE